MACLRHTIQLRVATTSVCTALCAILTAFTVLSLLNRPLDEKGTLVINNRYIRLAPRIASILVFGTIWIHDWEDPTILLAILSTIIFAVVAFEWYASMETGWQVFEPKHVMVWDKHFSRSQSRDKWQWQWQWQWNETVQIAQQVIHSYIASSETTYSVRHRQGTIASALLFSVGGPPRPHARGSF